MERNGPYMLLLSLHSLFVSNLCIITSCCDVAVFEVVRLPSSLIALKLMINLRLASWHLISVEDIVRWLRLQMHSGIWALGEVQFKPGVYAVPMLSHKFVSNIEGGVYEVDSILTCIFSGVLCYLVARLSCLAANDVSTACGKSRTSEPRQEFGSGVSIADRDAVLT